MLNDNFAEFESPRNRSSGSDVKLPVKVVGDADIVVNAPRVVPNGTVRRASVYPLPDVVVVDCAA